MPDQFAPISIPASPHAFTFGGRAWVGYLTGWSGATERRYVAHKFAKRKGQRIEDMERDGRWLQVRLVFIGATCAADEADFERFVDAHPIGRLDHPVVGQWTAFCVGPQSQADFNRATNRLEVNVRFIESELDAEIPNDTPDVGTAGQNVAAQQIVTQQSVATQMGALGKSQTTSAAALNAIDSALSQVDAATAPVVAMQTTVNQALGASSLIIATINLLATQATTLNDDVTSFVNATIDLFSGSDTAPAGTSDNIANTLAQVQADAQALEDTMTASVAGATAAHAGDAVRDVELLVDTCLTLNDAIAAQLPPVALYTVAATINLIVLAQQLLVKFGIVGRDPLVYASSILGLNRIPFPQAIPGGTTLVVPTA